jgi:hypothetical protein
LSRNIESFGLWNQFHAPQALFDWNRLSAAQLKSFSNFPTLSTPHDLSAFIGLTSLVLNGISQDVARNQRLFRNLPLTIQKLHLSFSKTAIPAAWISYFPKTLTELDMRIFGLTEKEETISPEEAQILSQFGSLTKLCLYFDMPKIEDYMLSWLPKHSLLTLMLTGKCPLLSSACFKYLPRFLQTFDVKHLAAHHDNDVIQLPRTLRSLRIPNSSFSTSVLPLLPTTILSITMREPKSFDYFEFQTTQQNSSFPDQRISSNSVNFFTHVPLNDEQKVRSTPVQHKKEFERKLRFLIYSVIGCLVWYFTLK